MEFRLRIERVNNIFSYNNVLEVLSILKAVEVKLTAHSIKLLEDVPRYFILLLV